MFAKCYLDADVNPLVGQMLSSLGFKVKTAVELNNRELNDEDQLIVAMSLESVLITRDKSTFLKDSKSKKKNHFGIIIITEETKNSNSVRIAKEIYDLYLNQYTADELMGFVGFV
ncbi:hypothetical protein COV18_02735 [Candidatus Woesearchaeota archaeon CG10_big_fil_rev_8_21_14_0_10_37_12]|nr:MAG: hypothetical protein COV18_02735 [Candidatus Woesearchaeota archaeon CG10_big_fil_rev_8_21_14_0_10_37_12]